VRDANPDALFAFVPAGVGSALMKQFTERGLDKAGIRLIAEGSVTDDDILDSMGDAALGVVTAHHYSAAHNSPANKAFVEAFAAANGGRRPNFMAVGAWDGMRLIYEGAKVTGGAGGEPLLNAMKSQSFESPRGPLQIDPATRDVVHNVYIRKVERVGGQLWNQEIETIPMVKDPGKTKP
jgi:branched-chain amino acid transport system substrate-binding protein